MKKLLTNLCFIFLVLSTSAQMVHEFEGQKYYPEDDPLVNEKLDQWQDLKFGLLMHWGAYSQWGIVESWSICPEDYGWCQRKKGNNPENYYEYVKEYEGLKNSFNPVDFNPEKWAKAASDAGMKYLVFTTKHHDGFCMFDSKYTDYKVTDEACAFHSNPKANITKEIFDAFRNEGLWAGAYFSKPDWHSDYYWDPYFPPFNRNVNYDPEAYPEKWQKFVDFTHNQILELMTDYGKIDILWLDGGWVAKSSKEEMQHSLIRKGMGASSGFLKSFAVNQDIKMDELVEKARKKQPGLIVVDRAVEGKNQNYLTPENKVPEEALPFPWESCIIAGGGWSYVPDAQYMSPRKAIHMLVDIVAKGGNLLYNIAPGPDGTWHDEAYQLLEAMGEWIQVNGEAIYSTRAIAPYKEANICFTRKKDSNTINAIYLADEGQKQLPAEIYVNSFQPKRGAKVSLLGDGKSLSWKKSGNGMLVQIPAKLRKNPPAGYAWVLQFEIAED
ncbi:alpha-L-fucosidase [Sunxiuqinia elliptica]|uniref:alpha-L-fucosidase n=1 Tax=Sunxiuqinia elliptica TaxID=655355 RepID=A0A4R6H4Z7_9BACT|nr:alpha-L-fucosidase [Sunxiuqinia elliptica]TDO02541.1 alpha-L-fucosidase [Sunxiuqinia elliptica]TDO58720.1 alpha-L-fucosidase [Sunxiuqinia elliptica]